MAMGGCQCGRVRYEIIGQLPEPTVCHCRDCQRQSGSAFGMSLLIPNGQFRQTMGSLRFFEIVCDSGRVKTCAFCGDCGTRIYHSTDGDISLKPGTLDDTKSLRPTHHYWAARRQPWFAFPEGAVSHPDDG
jgi:hypothetical protein